MRRPRVCSPDRVSRGSARCRDLPRLPLFALTSQSRESAGAGDPPAQACHRPATLSMHGGTHRGTQRSAATRTAQLQNCGTHAGMHCGTHRSAADLAATASHCTRGPVVCWRRAAAALSHDCSLARNTSAAPAAAAD